MKQLYTFCFSFIHQKLKHLNKLSTHAKACFKSVPDSVFKRLTRLTTIDDSNMNKNDNEVHPDHAKALRRAELIKMNGKLPTFQELLIKEEKDKKKIKIKIKMMIKTSVLGMCFFVLVVANFGKKPYLQ